MKNSTSRRRITTLAHGLTVLVAALAIRVAQVPAWANSTPFSQIVVFGDSLSDDGTAGKGLYYWTNGGWPLPPYWDGRFSDGPVWVEFLTTDLGLAQSSLHDYAVGGATSGTAVNFPVPDFHHGVQNQIADYLSSNRGDADALYIVAVGYNDIFIPLDEVPMGDLDAARSAYYQNTIDNIKTLRAAGARHILTWNLTDLGAGNPVPAVRAFLSALTVSFNDALGAARAELAVEGVPTIGMDMFTFANTIYANPAQYGFTSVADVPWPEAPVPGDAFYGGHPSTQFHQLIAQFAERCLVNYFSPSRGKGMPPAQVNALNGLVRAGKP